MKKNLKLSDLTNEMKSFPNVDQNQLEKRQNVPWLGVTPRMIRKR